MAEQKQDELLEHTFSSYVRIRDVALMTCQRRWMIGRSSERESGISELAARYDDDDIGLMSRVFGNGPGDRSPIPSWVITKTQKMVLDDTLLNTQHYKVNIKGKEDQFRERVREPSSQLRQGLPTYKTPTTNDYKMRLPVNDSSLNCIQ